MKRFLKVFKRRTRLVFHTVPAQVQPVDPFIQALEDSMRPRKR